MEVKLNKKKSIKIIVIIIIIAILVIGGIFIVKMIKENKEIKETENKISSIKAEELQTEIINALGETEINLNTGNYSTICKDTSIIEETEYPNKELMEKLNGFVVAGIMANNNYSQGIVIIPLFKIESDNKGYVKNISYISTTSNYYEISEIIQNTIESVLKEKYGIDTMITGNKKYNVKYNSILRNSNKKTEIIYTSEYWLLDITEKIVGYNDYHNDPTLNINTFGLDS